MRKDVVIDGAHAQLFADFVEFKHSVGYGYPRQTIEQLRQFSRFIATYPTLDTILSKEMVDAYCIPRDGEAVSTRKKRGIMARQFALYLQTIGFDCYLPPENHEPDRTDFIPYIITEDEMHRIIACADDQPYLPHTPNTKHVYSMLIRMLWCCGLRIGEAVALTVGDVNLDDAVLTISRAKHNRTRFVPMSETLTQYAREYWEKMGFIRENPTALFYPNPRKKKYDRVVASRHVKKIIINSGVAGADGKSPRVHDIRHSFAVRSLRKMEEDGIDIYCSLPLLSAYMGHSDIKSTEYYLRLTGSAFSEIAEAMHECYDGVFPEVDLI